MEIAKYTNKNGGRESDMKQIMYIGPDVKGVVSKNQLFTYDPKDKKEQVKEKYGPAEKFFVDVDDLAKKRNELKRKGSYLELLYRNLEKTLGGNNG